MTNQPTKRIYEDQKYDHTTAQDTYSGDIEYDGHTVDTELQNYKNMDVTKDTNMPWIEYVEISGLWGVRRKIIGWWNNNKIYSDMYHDCWY